MSETRKTDIITNQILSPLQPGLGRPRRVRRFLLVSTGLLIALALIWAGYALKTSHMALLIGDLALIALGLIALSLIRFGYVAFAIHTLLIALLIWIPAMAYFVSGSGVNENGAVHYWLVVYIVGLHFVLFDAARIVQTFYVAAAILEFVVIEYNLVGLAPAYGFPPHDTLFGHGLTLGLVLIGVAVIMRTYIADLADAEHRVRDGYHRSEQLLYSVLPPSIADRVRDQGRTFTQRVDHCSVLFADIVGFTPMASRLSAEALVGLLNDVFSRFDALTQRHGVVKIKTIGDGYMVASGLTETDPAHAQKITALAMDMLNVIREFDELSVRIGINSGPVIAGVIGRQRIAFDLWGETVNVASRMESHGVTDRVQVAEATYELIAEQFALETEREIDVKGKGLMRAYVLAPVADPDAAD